MKGLSFFSSFKIKQQKMSVFFFFFQNKTTKELLLNKTTLTELVFSSSKIIKRDIETYTLSSKEIYAIQEKLYIYMLSNINHT
jgi:hypothetical protein